MRTPSRVPLSLKFTVAICTLNRRRYVEKAIDEVLRQINAFENALLLIIDNGSTDGTIEYLLQASTHPQVRVAQEPRRSEYYARARAIDEAMGEFLIFLDDDAVPKANWLVGMLGTLLSDPELGVVGCSIEPIWEGLRPPWLSDRLLREIPIYDVDYAFSAARFPSFPAGISLGIRLNECAQLYICDERRNDYQLGRRGTIADGQEYQILGGADTDICEIYARNGYRVGFTNLARVAHVVPESRLVPEYYLQKFASEGVLRIRLSRLTGRRAVNRHSFKMLAFLPALMVLQPARFAFPARIGLLVQAYYLKSLSAWQELLRGRRPHPLPYYCRMSDRPWFQGRFAQTRQDNH